jgi:hypothetical protein
LSVWSIWWATNLVLDAVVVVVGGAPVVVVTGEAAVVVVGGAVVVGFSVVVVVVRFAGFAVDATSATSVDGVEVAW